MIKLLVFKSNGELISQGFYNNQSEINALKANPENLKRWGAGYTTQQYNAQDEFDAIKDDYLFEHGKNCIRFIRAVNKKKIESGQLTYQQFLDLMNDPNAEKIERFLWNCSFPSAKLLINNFSSVIYSAEEKQMLINYIDSVR